MPHLYDFLLSSENIVELKHYIHRNNLIYLVAQHIQGFTNSNLKRFKTWITSEMDKRNKNYQAVIAQKDQHHMGYRNDPMI